MVNHILRRLCRVDGIWHRFNWSHENVVEQCDLIGEIAVIFSVMVQ
jgi:hypothetical protein